jgi:hypothetical protein
MTRRSSSVSNMLDYASTSLGLDKFFRDPGDGRVRPQISARDLICSQIGARLLRVVTFHGIERLVESGSARGLGSNRVFREDSLAYFNARLSHERPRAALADTAKRAKRNKVFRGHTRIGLAIDGTGAGRCSARSKVCEMCRPYHDADGNVVGHRHEVVMIAVVGTGVTLPVDVEPCPQGEGELTAGIRLLQRAASALGPRFADYVVGDAKYGAASFLNAVTDLRLHAVVRLKDNLPDLHGRAVARFNSRPPDRHIQHEGVDVEIWDDETFQPWEGLSWPSVRVLRYRYTSRKGEVVDAYWLTDYAPQSIGSEPLFKLAKSRWEIENQGFNDAKNRYGMEHICHHDAKALIVGWLLLMLSLVIERLYRLCHLHRGSHERPTAADLVAVLWRALGRRAVHDTS